jgi:hypothetical protein
MSLPTDRPKQWPQMNNRMAALQPIRAQNELYTNRTSPACIFLLEDRSNGYGLALGLYQMDDVLRYGLEPVKCFENFDLL